MTILDTLVRGLKNRNWQYRNRFPYSAWTPVLVALPLVQALVGSPALAELSAQAAAPLLGLVVQFSPALGAAQAALPAWRARVWAAQAEAALAVVAA